MRTAAPAVPRRQRSNSRGQIQSRGNNRWLVRVPRGTDAHRKRLYHNKTIYGTKRDAQRYLAKVLREVDLGNFVESSQESLSDFLEHWLTNTVGKRIREHTLDDYRTLTRNHILPTLGAARLSQLTTERIEEVYTALSKRGLSPRTVRYVHSVLHNALEHAVDRGKLAKNPTKKATLPRECKREMRSLSVEEAARLLVAAKESRFEALVQLLLVGGLRPAEALGLKWADFDGDRIRVQRSLVSSRDGGPHFDAPKTDRARRSIPLPPTVVGTLRALRATQNAERLKAGPKWTDLDLVFTTREGKPLEWRVIARRHLRPLLRAASVQALRPYDLRHSCATLLLSSGENAKVVSERLGHASVALTLDVYSHVLPDMQQGAAEKLEQLLFAAPLVPEPYSASR
jgi:integrase